MDRGELLLRLVRLRELQLKREANQLRWCSGALSKVRLMRTQARFAASELIEAAAHLGDLGMFGEIRLGCTRRELTMNDELSTLSRKVGHARKLAESAREAQTELKRAHAATRERSLEGESEHFFGWKTHFKRGR